ncbi:copper-containing nitrite reductase [Kiritimatiellaeota bacterium B1221]|nr:copper-containing nitrite reductase [Kiritimatiellaeota bacterium B1221]
MKHTIIRKPCIASLYCLSTLFRLQSAELPVEKARMTAPPRVPPAITRNHPAKVIVEMEVVEKVMRLADGVDYMFWTFGGTVPGTFIRVREGDQVEFNLHNHPDNKLPHNIDLHAVTGQGGGAEGSFTAPGHSSKFNFKALKPGLFVYHCATQPVGMHIANGMYGLILVEPLNGLSKVDKEFYVFQSEFYTEGAHGEEGLQPFSMDKAIKEQADYVVFNGSVGALTGDNALQVNKGETVRLFVGNGGPNLASSFHVIGEIFDWVYPEAGLIANRNVQTTTVPPGGAAMVEFTTEVPGTFIMVDHAIFRAFNKGALGMIKVTGEEDHEIYSGKISDSQYQTMVNSPDKPLLLPKTNAAQKALTLDESIEAGKTTYQATCMACHQANGLGIPGVFPPLAKSDFLFEDIGRAIDIVINGKQGPITVNGKNYNQVMTPQNLTDEEISNVMNFILNSWGNEHPGQIDPAKVKQIRAK